jgi:hypothetical protein
MNAKQSGLSYAAAAGGLLISSFLAVRVWYHHRECRAKIEHVKAYRGMCVELYADEPGNLQSSESWSRAQLAQLERYMTTPLWYKLLLAPPRIPAPTTTNNTNN